MFEHDYDKKPFELLSLKEQLEQVGLLEQEIEKIESEKPSIDEIKEFISANKQKESKYWRFKDGALSYFNKYKEVYKWISRKQMQKIDGGLYHALRGEGNLEIAIPRTVRRDFSKIDPVQYFNNHYAQHCQTVIDLFKRDQTLYNVLHRLGKLDDLLDKKEFVNYNNNPLEIFRADIKYQGLSRTQLNKMNRSLYRALHYHNQMDEAIPVKQVSNFDKIS